MNKTKMPLLRYYIPQKRREEHINELINTCYETGIEEVLLFTSMSYAAGSGFVSKIELEKRIEHLMYCSQKIKEAGLKFSLNVFTTLGHVYVPKKEIDHFSFERQINVNGDAAQHPVLDPCCINLQEYLQKAYKKYAKLQPRLMFVDDDFNIKLKNCFHPDRLQRFSDIFGCSPELNTVKSLLFSENQNIRIKARKVMFQLVTSDLVSLAIKLREVVHEQSPDTRIGLMYPVQPFCDIEKVARAFAGDKRPLVRPQIPLYREIKAVAEYPGIFWNLKYWKAKLPYDFDLFPEVENYPYIESQKSSSSAIAHISSCFAIGETTVALSLNSYTKGVPAGESRKIVNKFALHKDQFMFLAKMMKGKTNQIGIGVWEADELQSLEISNLNNLNLLQLFGFPLVSTTKPENAVAFLGEGVVELNEKNLEGIIHNGFVFDLDAAKILNNKGILRKIGLDIGGKCSIDDFLNIEFTRFDGSKEDWPIYYFIREVEEKRLPLKVNIEKEDKIIFYKNYYGKKTMPFAIFWQGSEKQCFAFINASLNNWPRFALMNPWMKELLTEAIEWVNSNQIPAKVEKGTNITLNILEVERNGDLIITLTSFHTAPQRDVLIKLTKNLAQYSYYLISKQGKRIKIPIIKENGFFLRINRKLECLEVLFFIGKNKVNETS